MKSIGNMAKIILTFDTEDFINDRSIKALYHILNLLNRYKLKGIFFITAHMAERISKYPKVLDLLRVHEIGYHSSSHSVRPIIPEFTDVKSYNNAVKISLERETSHINPLTGEIETEGGINVLKDLFSEKEVISYRAPGLCWTPPHLEALKKLGIEFDFSTDISDIPFYYKGITFYPFFFGIDPIEKNFLFPLYNRGYFFNKILNKNWVILCTHPDFHVNSQMWDSIYFDGNPKTLLKVESRNTKEIKIRFLMLKFLFKKLEFLEKMNLISVTTELEMGGKLDCQKLNTPAIYERSVWWSKNYFNYNPKFLFSHFCEFF